MIESASADGSLPTLPSSSSAFIRSTSRCGWQAAPPLPPGAAALPATGSAGRPGCRSLGAALAPVVVPSVVRPRASVAPVNELRVVAVDLHNSSVVCGPDTRGPRLVIDHGCQYFRDTPAYSVGFTGCPFTSTSKCRCGPVLRPELPDLPTIWPSATTVAGPNRLLGQVRVPGLPAALVVHDDRVAVAALHAGKRDHAVCRGLHVAPVGHRDIDALVKPRRARQRVVAPAELAADRRRASVDSAAELAAAVDGGAVKTRRSATPRSSAASQRRAVCRSSSFDRSAARTRRAAFRSGRGRQSC